MRKTIEACVCAVLLAASLGARGAGAAEEKPQEEERAPGRRLSVRFQETRQRGDSATATRSCTLSLHADAETAHFFLGTVVAIAVSDPDTPTTIFKNVGVAAHVRAEALPDGRYRVAGGFEDSSVLAARGTSDAPVTGGNPILRVVKGESSLTVSDGETVPFASAVDPVTGEVVRVDLTVTAVTTPEPRADAETGDARVRARLVLVRRQGQADVARRPYTVVLATDEEDGASVFGGSQLPVQTKVQGHPTVALKDIGSGLRLKAHRVAGGRYRLDVEFSDGVLSPGRGAPEIRTFESASQVFVRPGETVTIAPSVDGESGEAVEARLTIESDREVLSR